MHERQDHKALHDTSETPEQIPAFSNEFLDLQHYLRHLLLTQGLERNPDNSALCKSVQDGFFLHPKDEDLSLGTRLRKKPLGECASGVHLSAFRDSRGGLLPHHPMDPEQISIRVIRRKFLPALFRLIQARNHPCDLIDLRTQLLRPPWPGMYGMRG